MQSTLTRRFMLAGKIGVAVLLVFLFAFWCLGAYRAWDRGRTAEAIERINSRRITVADVMGDHLPPAPDQQLNDSTVAGIDANNNAIRDDVELAIFAQYPNSAKIRAAMLQYAQALQLELTEVNSSETLVEVLRKRVYARLCIVNDLRKKEIDSLVINTALRKEKQADDLEKYTTTYSVPSDRDCDIDLASLPN